MIAWKVRRATEKDIDFLVDCGVTLAFETENKVLEKTTVYKGVKDCIENPKLGCYYVASNDNGENMGTTMITIETSIELGGQINWI